MIFDAVVLAGGEGLRMGGVDKAALALDGEALLEMVLDGVRDAERVVVVGPKRFDRTGLLWTSEDPPGGGPAAALDAGLQLVNAPTVAVVAVDHPFVTRELVAELARLLEEGVDGVAVSDEKGVAQPLVAVYRTGALRHALGAMPSVAGASMREVTSYLRVVLVEDPAAARDIDTPADLEAARRLRRDG